jgi:hypothetical protein
MGKEAVRVATGYFGPAPSAPVTPAGASVPAALLSTDLRRALKAVPRSAAEIVGQVLLVALRRRYVGASAESRVDSVSGALAGLGEPKVRSGILLVGSVLSGGPLDMDGTRRTRGTVALALLEMLRTSGHIASSDSDLLVATAEARAVRVWRRRLSAGRRLSVWPGSYEWAAASLLKQYASVAWPVDAEPVPASRIGQQVRALGRHDFEQLALIPEPEQDDDVGTLAVADTVLEAIIKRRFSAQVDEVAAADLVHRALRNAPEPADAAHAGIRVAMEGSLAQDPTASALRARLRVFAQLVDDLGLYDTELDELIVMAENAAKAQGIQPTPMPRQAPAGRDHRN